jgi:hypothetical protein
LLEGPVCSFFAGRTFLSNDRVTACFLLWFKLVPKFNRVPQVSLIKKWSKIKRIPC